MFVRISQHEFKSEGSEEAVKSQFKAFKDLVASYETVRSDQVLINSSQLASIFDIQRENKVIKLRLLPDASKGQIRHIANCMLVIMYGFKRQLDITDLPVVLLAECLRMSGLHGLSRLSTAFGQACQDGLMMKVGFGKGTKYQATVPGLALAEELIQNTLKHYKI